ncbi:Protein eyes shut [Clonorchis sinensis]|uniref:Protein eyes shut n=1 Tax=Clonorchis sinensis TaxID=79923 RepID=A0A3R7EVI2_CLOSI|nr:Protein eyes shut [Clonorchis sinensis]
MPCEHGTCQEPNYCRCESGWYGKSCEKCHVYPGCVHGTCERNRTTHALVVFTCSCEPGWGGMLCDIDLNFCSRHPGICQNGGHCVNNQRHTDAFHHCHCRQGYQGRHCELIEVDCRTQGCNGAGRCVKQQSSKQHACECSPGHFGDLCESTQPIAEPILSANGSEFSKSERDTTQECANNTCLNGGLCVELPGGFSCKCPQGFGGHRCESDLCGCGKSQDCLAKCMNATQHSETMSDPGIKHITIHQHSSGWDILTFVIVATLLGSGLVVLFSFTLCWFRARRRDLPFAIPSNCDYCAIQNESFQTFNNQLENGASCHVSAAKLFHPQTTELETPGFLPTDQTNNAIDYRQCETESVHQKSKLTSTWIDVQQLFTDIHNNSTKVAKQHMCVMR